MKLCGNHSSTICMYVLIIIFTLRYGVYGNGGTTLPGYPLGIEDRTIPDSSLTASSVFTQASGAHRARLNIIANESLHLFGGWTAGHNNIHQWIQVDLSTTYVISGVAIQGRQERDQWVESFKVACSVHGVTFDTVEDPSNHGGDLVFAGNNDRNTVVYATLPEVLQCRYVRLIPWSWNNFISLRFEVYEEKNVTCGYVTSDITNVFDSYDVAVASWAGSHYSLTFHPSMFGPTNMLPVGTTEMTVTAHTSSSLATEIGTCIFNVTVSLSELPIVCPPTNYTKATDPGEPTFQFQNSSRPWLPGYDYRPFNLSLSVLSTNTTGVVDNRFPVGIHDVSVRYYDDYIDKVCNFTITVLDAEPPRIICPGNKFSNTTNVITYTHQKITDNVPDPDVLEDSIAYIPAAFSPGYRFPLGTHTTTISVTDAGGNEGICRFNVTVSLVELPIVCPPTMNLTVGTDPGQPFYTYPNPPFNVTYLSESVTYIPYGNITMVRRYGGNSSDPRLTISLTPHLITIEISDGTLSKSCHEAAMTVEDMEPPRIRCPGDILSNTTNVITYMHQNITDNVADAGPLNGSIAYSPNTLSPGSRFPLGISDVTISVIDGAGNQGNCSFDVNVALRDLPIVCPPTMNLTVGTDPGQPFYTYQNPATFNITYLPESVTYMSYGNITMVRRYGGNPSDRRLTISPTAHLISIEISDGALTKLCNEARVTVEGFRNKRDVRIGCTIAVVVFVLIIVLLLACCIIPDGRIILGICGINAKEPEKGRGMTTDGMHVNKAYDATG